MNLTSDDEVHRQLRVQGRRLPARTMDGLDETMGCWFSDDGLWTAVFEAQVGVSNDMS